MNYEYEFEDGLFIEDDNGDLQPNPEYENQRSE